MRPADDCATDWSWACCVGSECTQQENNKKTSSSDRLHHAPLYWVRRDLTRVEWAEECCAENDTGIAIIVSTQGAPHLGDDLHPETWGEALSLQSLNRFCQGHAALDTVPVCGHWVVL